MRQDSPRQQFRQAQIIATENGMFVVDKGDRFLLYRKSPMRPVFLGKTSSPDTLRSLVTRCATTK